MKVTINNQACFIDWVHFTKPCEGIQIGTHCRILNATDHSIVAVGATQLSVKDQFDKKVGRKLSLQRVLKAANVPKPDRKAIWVSFLTNVKH